jgi:ribosome-binding factor A
MSKKPGSPKGPSQRQLRVGELIRHELSALFMRGDVMDPVIEKTGVTVLEVATSPDLKIATAYVRPFQPGWRCGCAGRGTQAKCPLYPW